MIRTATLANKLIATTLAEAENEHVLGAQTELLIEAGQIATRRHVIWLEQRNTFVRQQRFRRPPPCRDRKVRPAFTVPVLSRDESASKASAVIDQGIQAVQRVEEGYDLPVFVAEKAEVQAALGSVQAADASFQRATDLVEGLLVNAPSSQVKSGMIGALRQIYLGSFSPGVESHARCVLRLLNH